MLILAISLSTLHKHFHPWVNTDIYIIWNLWLLSRKVSFPTTEKIGKSGVMSWMLFCLKKMEIHGRWRSYMKFSPWWGMDIFWYAISKKTFKCAISTQVIGNVNEYIIL